MFHKNIPKSVYLIDNQNCESALLPNSIDK